MWAARRAQASVRPDVGVKIFFTVVIRQLFSGGDLPERVDLDLAAPCVRHAIGSARVIYIPAEVLPTAAVDGPSRVYSEQVLAATAIRLLIAKESPCILDDEILSGKVACRKKPEPCLASPDDEPMRVVFFHSCAGDITDLPPSAQYHGSNRLPRRRGYNLAGYRDPVVSRIQD